MFQLDSRTSSKEAEVAQLVEHLLAKEKVVSSNLIFRSIEFVSRLYLSGRVVMAT